MNTAGLKKFAQVARRQLLEQVGARLQLVLSTDSAELREQERAVTQLKDEIAKTSKEAVIERVAYIWFNRFCALRFMDVNRYSKIGVVSPAEGFSQPEILQDAKQGHIDDELRVDKQKVFDLLGGRATATDPQQEAYRLLLVAVCNDFNQTMPFMFQQISDYTELLIPDDLLSEDSLLQAVREALTEETCQDVEVIGWLYQFYISEKKDQVFEGLKKNQKITPENIPAATQLFTPHWIVRYLVENSLGRLWLLNRPVSKLAEQMDYYIKPEEAETDFLKVGSPEELKICDPACGSGHMLTYAFDLLYLIYEEEGYDPKEIPQLILVKNLFGIEIDERAGELAAFALTMKALQYDKRFFHRAAARGELVEPNICVLENVEFAEEELQPYMEAVGRDLFTMNLRTLLQQFKEADNFGSLIRPAQVDVAHVRKVLDEKRIGSLIAFAHTHPRVLKVLRQSDFLSPKHHVVIANPPYMGSGGMNGRLGAWVKESYPNSKSDLFAMFIERNLGLARKLGAVAMITMQSWMFLSSFEKLRSRLLEQNTILSMAHLGARAFDSIGGEVVSTTAFVLKNENQPEFKGEYLRLVGDNSETNKEAAIRGAIKNYECGWFFRASAADFKKLPSKPIAYWVSKRITATFDEPTLSEVIITEGQNKTANNDKFVRTIWEVNRNSIGINKKWLLYAKGGDFRKWFGNIEHLVDWSNKARLHYRKDFSCRIIAEKYWYREGITWTDISSSGTGFRYLPADTTYDMSGPTAFFENSDEIYTYLCLLNSIFVKRLLPVLNPTLHSQLRDIKSIPRLLRVTTDSTCKKRSQLCISYGKGDWDSHETSFDFNGLPLIQPNNHKYTLKTTYKKLRTHWHGMTLETQRLEEENNRIFIEAYDLQDELPPDVPLNEITLTCNPHYRYGGNKSEEELEVLLLADTLKEFLSYAVGCMFGRYSPDKPGLVLANQGETLEDYLQQIPEPTFPTDSDNVIPILDDDWFMDDIAGRFRAFLKLTFGEEHYTENLKFLEEAIGKDIRKYFLKDFYSDHVQRYKKRPIYWLFSSPKGSFNALIYMHRYRPDTVSVVLNDYLREFRTKLGARKEHLEQVSISATASKVEKTKALKEVGQLKQTIDELNSYETEILFPLATQKIEIDLDDGVAINYKKFGKALKHITGLTA